MILSIALIYSPGMYKSTDWVLSRAPDPDNRAMIPFLPKPIDPSPSGFCMFARLVI